MSFAVILANGMPPHADTVARVRAGAACLVCADGGANSARSAGIVPDAIIGDLDSVDPATLRHFAGVPRVLDADPERTDTEKAIEWLLAREAWERIVILGATAGRLDHVVGHLALLRRYAERVHLVLEDDHGRAWLARSEVEIDVPVGTIVSFFAVGAAAEGVTTENLRYPLRDRRLELGMQDSISNVVSGRPARIHIESGELLVVVVSAP
jgi:thiamine pyrophosphokinase